VAARARLNRLGDAHREGAVLLAFHVSRDDSHGRATMSKQGIDATDIDRGTSRRTSQ
jgi:hypothetical protein